MKYAMSRIVVVTYVLWFLFVTTAVDALHNHGPFDDDPVLDWYESQLCKVFLLQRNEPSAMEASTVELARLLDYCPASTYLAASTGNALEILMDIPYEMMILGSSREEEPVALMPLLHQLPPSRGPPVA